MPGNETTSEPAHLARLPAPTEHSLVPEIFNIEAIHHFILRKLLLTVDARPRLPGLGDEVQHGGEDEVEKDGQEEEEGEEGQPFLSPEVGETPEGLRDG